MAAGLAALEERITGGGGAYPAENAVTGESGALSAGLGMTQATQAGLQPTPEAQPAPVM